ncbi:mRNA surveillance protein pelota [Candidatus Woesearchaeota archaeon]|nr:mRNA surveillance protein pelota [Candidatus Woesearchaeota archaeon]
MDIIKHDYKTGEATIRITDEEDLWHLSHLIEPEDLVKGQTERKIKIGSEDNFKVVRKKVYLKLETEKTEYVPENNSLRILGPIKEGPDDVSLGSYHSFNLEINDIITLTKKTWSNYQIKRLKESTIPRKKSLLTIFDREEAIIGILTQKGFEKLTEIKGDVKKKIENSSGSDSFFKELAKTIHEYKERLKTDRIILGSPAFWKEYVLKELPEETRKKTMTCTISNVSETSIKELLKSPELGKTLDDDRSALEEKHIEELMKAISEEKAFYGIKEATEKINLGATSQVIISEKFLKESRDKGNYKEIDKLLRTAEGTNSEVIIITQKEPITKIDGLGGIAGILRWKI